MLIHGCVEKGFETSDQVRYGSPEDFTCLVEAYQRPVFNLCYRMLGGPEAAEDAAQETFLKAYQHLAGYDPRRPFSTWLLSIAAHHCIDCLRRKHFAAFSLDENEDREAWLPDRGAADPEEETDRHWQDRRLHALLQALEPAQRSVLVLHFWQGFTELEIANMLHLSPAAVKSRLYRARQALSRLWQVQPNACVTRAELSYVE